jgi:hypothetical protein
MPKRSQKKAVATEPPLFAADAADGHRYAFGILNDGCCAITRDGKVMKAWNPDDFGIDTAVDEYCALTSPGGRKCVSARVRAFAVQPRSQPNKGRRSARQHEAVHFERDQSS